MSEGARRLFLTTDAVGGVWTYSLDLAAALAPLGIDTTLAVLGPPPGPAQRQAAAAVPNLRLIATGLPLDWTAPDAAGIEGAAASLSRLGAQEGADIVQLHAPALAAAPYPCPVVAVVHSCLATWWRAVKGDAPLPADFVWRTNLARAGLEAADMAVAPSAAFARAVRDAYGLREPPQVVHNGRSPLPAPTQAPHDFVFTAGRLWDEGKDVRTLDEAAGRLAVPVRAAGALAGPGGEAAAFRHLHLLGQVDETALARWLGARPVYASTAVYEPFGLSVLEAAAAGCALVLADNPTFRELWDEAALFVPMRDAGRLSATLGDLVGDDFERAVLGRAAQERARLFTPAAMAAQMAALYRSLLPAVRRPVLAARAA